MENLIFPSAIHHHQNPLELIMMMMVTVMVLVMMMMMMIGSQGKLQPYFTEYDLRDTVL
jgi:hypothetical protein